MEKGLPTNLEAERLVLGAILLDDTLFINASAGLNKDDLSLEKHRAIFQRMADLQERGEKIDRVTVANELRKTGQFDMVGGLSYLVSLDDGMPRIPNIDSYIRMVKGKADLRRLIYSGQVIIDRAMLEDADPATIASDATSNLLRLASDSGKRTLIQVREAISEYPGGVEALLSGSQDEGIPTGFTKLDEYTNGLHRGDLVILAARPSMGKTALALNIAQQLTVRDQKTVAVFSLEMSVASLLLRMLSSAARVDGQKIRSQYLSAEERLRLAQALSDLSQAPLFIDDSSMLSLADIHARLRRLKLERGGLDLAIVDYLQLMPQTGRSSNNRNEELGVLTRGMKLIAKDLDIPLICLSQLSRAPDQRQDHRPMLSDLRESGNIEQDADLVAFIFREEVYRRDDEDLRGVAELIIAKQRNGPIGTVPLVFLNGYTRFENRSDDVPPQEQRVAA